MRMRKKQKKRRSSNWISFATRWALTADVRTCAESEKKKKELERTRRVAGNPAIIGEVGRAPEN